MSGLGATLGRNARWEWTRLKRSQRAFLLVIPPVAGPVGSVVADLYLHLPDAATAVVLGLLVTAGLSALVLLDLTALAVGEDLVRRAHVALFPLPQDRRAALAGRLLVAVGGPLLAYGLAAGAVWGIGGSFVGPGTGPPPRALFDPGHLLLSIPALLVGLAGITAVAAVVTRSASEAIVAGVLGGVVVAGGIGYLVAQGSVTLLEPGLLAVAGVAALGYAVSEYPSVAE